MVPMMKVPVCFNEPGSQGETQFGSRTGTSVTFTVTMNSSILWGINSTVQPYNYLT